MTDKKCWENPRRKVWMWQRAEMSEMDTYEKRLQKLLNCTQVHAMEAQKGRGGCTIQISKLKDFWFKMMNVILCNSFTAHLQYNRGLHEMYPEWSMQWNPYQNKMKTCKLLPSYSCREHWAVHEPLFWWAVFNYCWAQCLTLLCLSYF